MPHYRWGPRRPADRARRDRGRAAEVVHTAASALALTHESATWFAAAGVPEPPGAAGPVSTCGSGRQMISGASVTTDRALAILEQLIAAFDDIGDREVARVLRAAWAHIDEHGVPPLLDTRSKLRGRIAPRA